MKILWQNDGYRITVASLVQYWIFEEGEWRDVSTTYRAGWVKDAYILAQAEAA